MIRLSRVEKEFINDRGGLIKDTLTLKDKQDVRKYEYKATDNTQDIMDTIEGGFKRGQIKSYSKNEVLDSCTKIKNIKLSNNNCEDIAYHFSNILGAITEIDVNNNTLKVEAIEGVTRINDTVNFRLSKNGSALGSILSSNKQYQFDGSSSTMDTLLNETVVIGELFEQFQSKSEDMFHNSDLVSHGYYPAEKILFPYYDIMKGVTATRDKYSTETDVYSIKKRDKGFIEVETVGYAEKLEWSQRERMFERSIASDRLDVSGWALNRSMNLPQLMYRQNNAYELYLLRCIYDNKFTYNGYEMPMGIPATNYHTASELVGSPLMTFTMGANGAPNLTSIGDGDAILMFSKLIIGALYKYTNQKITVILNNPTLQALVRNSSWDFTKFGSGLLQAMQVTGDAYVKKALEHFGGSKRLGELLEFRILEGLYNPDENDPFGRPEATSSNGRNAFYMTDIGKIIITVHGQNETKSPLIRVVHTPIIQNGMQGGGVPASSPAYITVDTIGSNTLSGVLNPMLYDVILFNMGIIIPVPELIHVLDMTI